MTRQGLLPGKNRLILASLLVCLLIAGVIALGLTRDRSAKAGPGVPDTEDSRLIQETILKKDEIECQSILTKDTSAFASVFVNDPRGYQLSSEDLRWMQSVTGEITRTDFGYMDLMTESFTFRPIPEVRQTPVRPPDGPPSLVPTARPVKVPCTGPMEVKFISIVVDGDQAVATFDNQASTIEMILVKIDGQWFIAGHRVLVSHN